MENALEELKWKNKVYHGQIRALLEVEDLSDVVLREEIPAEKIREGLKGLKAGQYDKILFENGGKIEIVGWRMNYVLPFEMVALSYLKKNWFTEAIIMQTINRTHYIDRKDRPPIGVRNPHFWRNNNYQPRDPTNEESNNLIINFGRFINRINLKINADWDLKAEEQRNEDGPGLYKVPSAMGYKLK
ncbi:hypothetical protein HOA91_06310 [Candidatus Woesearchaeota archaeon]|nr:hypothetical protein [Candidatus Woesearchaeota archaeon]